MLSDKWLPLYYPLWYKKVSRVAHQKDEWKLCHRIQGCMKPAELQGLEEIQIIFYSNEIVWYVGPHLKPAAVTSARSQWAIQPQLLALFLTFQVHSIQKYCGHWRHTNQKQKSGKNVLMPLRTGTPVFTCAPSGNCAITPADTCKFSLWNGLSFKALQWEPTRPLDGWVMILKYVLARWSY